MSTRHAAIWLDHQEAKIFHFTPESIERSELHVAHHLYRAHKTGGHAERHRDVAEQHPFFEDIVTRLGDAAEVLVVGPAETKSELVKFLQARHPDLAGRIVGVEAADHPTDGQIVAHARKYFLAADRTLP
jgi:stalled ribosome rescue protein Dom34